MVLVENVNDHLPHIMLYNLIKSYMELKLLFSLAGFIKK